MSILSKLLREVISRPCLDCGKFPATRHGFCSHCIEKLPFVLSPHCSGCGAENDGIFELCGKCLKESKRPWNYAFALMRMEGNGRKLIHQLKYENSTALARGLGELAAEKLKVELQKQQNQTNNKASNNKKQSSNEETEKGDTIAPYDYIVPVPLHWTRRLTRGYNQSALLAEIISKEINIPVNHLLRRTKLTPKQMKLNRAKRLKNLNNAFAVRDKKSCENRKILLIDDVMTTGTTLSVASQTILDAGAKTVNVLALLRA